MWTNGGISIYSKALVWTYRNRKILHEKNPRRIEKKILRFWHIMVKVYGNPSVMLVASMIMIMMTTTTMMVMERNYYLMTKITDYHTATLVQSTYVLYTRRSKVALSDSVVNGYLMKKNMFSSLPRLFLMRYSWSTSDLPGQSACPWTSSANTHPGTMDMLSQISNRNHDS
jgi:hypothetical protein